MKLVKVKGENNYTWEGLTLGKLIAIRDALETVEASTDKLTAVKYDVMRFLQNQDLDSQVE